MELALGARLYGPILRRDDAGRDRLRQAERTADRDHPVTHLCSVGITEFDRGKRGRGFNLDDRDIGRRIDADHLGGTAKIGVRIGIGRQFHVNLVGLIHHVVVGDDVAARIDDEAGA